MSKGKVLIDGEPTKKCALCKTEKHLADFNLDGSSPDGKGYYCRDCANAKAREHHAKKSSDPAWVAKKNRKDRDRVRALKQKAVEYMGSKCHDCQTVYPNYVYDFHHLDGDTKLDNPSALLRSTWDRAKVELDKCIMVCANCHRGRHYDDAEG